MSNLGNTQWQTARVPKLSYRKPLSPEEAASLPVRSPITIPVVQEAPTTTRQDIALATNPLPLQQIQQTQGVQVVVPKKKSLFGALFAKEPTLVALAQVEAELKQKHGAATAETVPHVSSRRMPAHVPKVNSRWDGVPEAVRVKEREQKYRNRMSQQDQRAMPTTAQSDGTDYSVGTARPPHRRNDSEMDGNIDLWRNGLSRTGSFYSSTSSGASHSSARNHNTSASSKSHDIGSRTAHPKSQPLIRAPQSLGSKTSAQTSSTNSSGFSHSQISAGEQLHPMQEHSFAPFQTSRGFSPGYHPDTAGLQVATVAELDAVRTNKPVVKPSSSRPKHVPIDAFLAGEARPVEFTHDDDDEYVSSPHHGRRTIQIPQSNVVRPHDARRTKVDGKNKVIPKREAVPWEAQDIEPGSSRIVPANQGQRRRSKGGLNIFK